MNTQWVAAYLKKLRQRHGYTQRELAAKLHLSRQAVSKWENGTAMPNLETLINLSKLYHITINAILEPDVAPKQLENFEQIISCPKSQLKKIRNRLHQNDFVFALMGASPQVNQFLQDVYPDVDWQALQRQAGSVPIAEVERAQKDVIDAINLCLSRASIPPGDGWDEKLV